ncbi:MAG: PQQ-dependent sugar dehydrogenase [Planctomycetes bacterium]|nr:PQQ-dependent sugar dehydrogenase [Planctomycetota bacterium]
MMRSVRPGTSAAALLAAAFAATAWLGSKPGAPEGSISTQTEAAPAPFGEGAFARAEPAGRLGLKRLATGLSMPLYVTAPPGDSGRAFIVERSGSIRILERATDTLKAAPFIQLSGLSSTGDGGLLCMAFHPDYATNGFFYVSYVDSSEVNRIDRYTVSAGDADLADAASRTAVLSYAAENPIHNGSWIAFGPDGFLYCTTRDGGTDFDPNDNAQNMASLVGKVLRIDVDNDDFGADDEKNYAVPIDNPYVSDAGALDEIWARGLRNAWRGCFDRANGDLYLADVGQEDVEEVDYQRADSSGGENYGWRLREGSIATPTGSFGGAPPAGNVEPAYDYRHVGTDGFPDELEGNSVIGGYVYRGPIERLRGKYFFGDFISKHVWSFEIDRDAKAVIEDSFTDWTAALPADAGTLNFLTSFGEDADGNLYLCDADGEVYRVVDLEILAGPLSVGRFKGRLQFPGAQKDRLAFKARLAMPDGFSVEGAHLIVDIGGVVQAFDLDAKGKSGGTDPEAKARLKVLPDKQQVQAGATLFDLTVTLKRGDFAADLADEGLDGTALDAPVERLVSVFVVAGGTPFISDETVVYKNRSGRKGSFKKKP